MIKFRRRKDICGTHPEGTTCIGIHALESDRWMTIDEIMEAHKKYCKTHPESISPTWGELLRDLGLFVCFHMVDVIEE